MSYISAKDAVMELLSSEDDTRDILSKVAPEQHDEVILLLRGVREELNKGNKLEKDGDLNTDASMANSNWTPPDSSAGSGSGSGNAVANSLAHAFGKGEDRKSGSKMDHGFFQTEHLHAVLAKPSHHEAKQYAHSLVDAKPNATPENKAKAKLMIDRSKNTRHLAQGMANFMMAHPKEGLGMNR